MKGYREVPEDKILNFAATPGFKGWRRFFTKDSVSHPAKMNLNLLRWILRTYTEPGEVVLDPMAGTGSTVILAALEGRNGVAVEYEPKFWDMIRDNIELTERQPWFFPKGQMAHVNGDARDLSQLLKESDTIITSPPYGNRLSDVAVHDGDPARMGYRQAVDTILTSPPYSDSNIGGDDDDRRVERLREAVDRGDVISERSLKWLKAMEEGRRGSICFNLERNYSEDPYNLGALPHGDIDAVVTSQPYEAGPFNHGGGHGGAYAGGIAQRDSNLKPMTLESENIGTLKGETYLEAMLGVYRECWKILKLGGKMVLVVKNFIRDKRVVRLDEDTIKLCEAAGFRLADHWYFRLPTRSFWRVLYHRKYPEVPQVEFEDVLVFETRKTGLQRLRGRKRRLEKEG